MKTNYTLEEIVEYRKMALEIGLTEPILIIPIKKGEELVIGHTTILAVTDGFLGKFLGLNIVGDGSLKENKAYLVDLTSIEEIKDIDWLKHMDILPKFYPYRVKGLVKIGDLT